MKTLKITLSAIALSTLAALAGPGGSASSFTTGPASQAHGCPMIKAQTKLVGAQYAKAGGPVQQITGYRHERCTGTSVTAMTCRPAGASCAAMRHG